MPFLGGGFGAKLYIKLEALVAVLSLITRKPVKISLSMEEQFFTITKHASTFRIKSAVDKDGRIVARECEVVERRRVRRHRPARDAEIRLHGTGAVRHRNVSIDSYALYTNLVPGRAPAASAFPSSCGRTKATPT